MDYTKAINDYKQLHGHSALQLRAVLFDMDGVLFDSMPYHADAWSKVMTDAGFNFTREDVYMNEGRTGADTINIASLAQFGKPATEELIDELREVAMEAIERCRRKRVRDWTAVKSAIKNDLSGYLYKTTKRNPMILPVIMEI